jgi:hypothetical protein
MHMQMEISTIMRNSWIWVFRWWTLHLNDFTSNVFLWIFYKWRKLNEVKPETEMGLSMLLLKQPYLLQIHVEY